MEPIGRIDGLFQAAAWEKSVRLFMDVA